MIFSRSGELEDDKNLLNYNIQDGATLNLRKGIQIAVKTPRGNTINLDVLPEDSIDKIKDKIQAKEGIPPEEQHLIYDRNELDDDKPLSNYNIRDGTTIDLRKGMRIKVKTLRGNTINLDVLPEDSIDKIKAKIQAKEGIPPEQ